MIRTDFNFRRTATTLTFCLAWIPVLGLLGWIVSLLRSQPDPLERIAMGLIGLLFVSTIGLAMTVALRQISARVAGIDIEASGGADPGSQPTAQEQLQ